MPGRYFWARSSSTQTHETLTGAQNAWRADPPGLGIAKDTAAAAITPAMTGSANASWKALADAVASQWGQVLASSGHSGPHNVASRWHLSPPVQFNLTNEAHSQVRRFDLRQSLGCSSEQSRHSLPRGFS